MHLTHYISVDDVLREKKISCISSTATILLTTEKLITTLFFFLLLFFYFRPAKEEVGTIIVYMLFSLIRM